MIHHTLTKFALILTPFSINRILNTAVASFVLVDIDCFLFIFYDWIWHQTWFDQKIFCCLQQNNLFELHSLIHYIWRKEKDPLLTRVLNKRPYLVVSHTNTHCWFPPAVLLSSPRLVVAWPACVSMNLQDWIQPRRPASSHPPPTSYTSSKNRTGHQAFYWPIKLKIFSDWSEWREDDWKLAKGDEVRQQGSFEKGKLKEICLLWFWQ